MSFMTAECIALHFTIVFTLPERAATVKIRIVLSRHAKEPWRLMLCIMNNELIGFLP